MEISVPAVPRGLETARQWVSTAGNDSSDGLSEFTPKLTIAAAVAALPSTGSGGTLRHYGDIRIGRGTFTENAGLELRADIRYIGSGAGSLGTYVKLANGQNASLFQYGTFTDFAHNVRVQDMTIDGNKANNASAGSCVEIYNGGYNCHFDNVTFKGAKDYGLKVVRSALTVMVVNCNWTTCGTGVYQEIGGTLSKLLITGGQVDNCVDAFMRIEHTGSGQGNQVTVEDLKLERQVTGECLNMFYLKPRTTATTAPVRLIIRGITIGGAATDGTNMFYEESQTGAAFKLHVEDVSMMPSTGGFAHLLTSDKTGQVQDFDNRVCELFTR